MVQLLVSVDDEDVHRSHFVARGASTGSRPTERYLELFDNIRRIHGYLMSMAEEHGVPVVRSFSLDTTLVEVIDLVVSEAVRNVPEAREPSDLPVVGGATTRRNGVERTNRNEVPHER